ncbi:MAG TPA: phosphonopyruvate decarboxylase [Polyangiaceae bacterium]|nr:phosphonopyruvate decarboxylase [Polyangiaceae bacterium]
MLAPKDFYDALTEAGISLFAGVPDSLLKDICAYVTDHTPPERNVITANEGNAVALAMGHYLATGKPGLVYMQNSGLGNTVNPLTSLADPAVYGIPMLLVVGWRGRPGEHDEPQHVKMGAVTLETLAAVGVPATVLPDTIDEARAALKAALADAVSRSAPHALVVKKGTFDAYKLQKDEAPPYEMTRERAIERVVAALPKTAAVVATTGMPSRELFETRERRKEPHASDLLTVGGMGHASLIALGVALEQPSRPVYCLDGDGAVLMHMGALATIAQLRPKGFKHVVLNNGAHDSVGGQPTVAFAVDLCAVARAAGYAKATMVSTEAELDAALADLAKSDGPSLLEVRVKKGSRKDLGRPTQTPQDLKRDFSGFLRG